MDDRAQVGSILVVGSRNVCRSPYIERSLGARLAGAGIIVSSAGTQALVGSAMEPEVVDRLAVDGGDAGGFVARGLTREMVVSAGIWQRWQRRLANS